MAGYFNNDRTRSLENSRSYSDIITTLVSRRVVQMKKVVSSSPRSFNCLLEDNINLVFTRTNLLNPNSKSSIRVSSFRNIYVCLRSEILYVGIKIRFVGTKIRFIGTKIYCHVQNYQRDFLYIFVSRNFCQSFDVPMLSI